MIKRVKIAARHRQEFKRCKEDHWYYLTRYCYIKHPARGLILFDPYDWQREFIDAVLAGQNIFMHKSRQVGFSWAFVSALSYLLMFSPNPQEVGMFSENGDKAGELKKKLMITLRHLPDWLLGKDRRGRDNPQIYISKNTDASPPEVHITHSERRGRQWIPKYIHVVKSHNTTTSSGASYSFTLAFVDELGRMGRQATEVWAGVAPAAAVGGQIIAGGTRHHHGRQFDLLLQEAQAGLLSGYKFMQVHYTDSGMTKEDILKTVGTLPQEIWDREYEMAETVAAGNPVFNLPDLAACYVPALMPGPRARRLQTLANARAVAGLPNDDAACERMLAKVELEIRASVPPFYSGVDSALGAHDENCIVTLNGQAVMVATEHNRQKLSQWAGRDEVSPDGFIAKPGTVTKWHCRYPGIMVIEKNGPGETVKSRHHPPAGSRAIYRVTGDTRNRTGTKSSWIRALAMAIEQRQITITDPAVYGQLCQYAYLDDSGKMGAAGGGLDDAVMATALAWLAYRRYGQSAPAEVETPMNRQALSRPPYDCLPHAPAVDYQLDMSKILDTDYDLQRIFYD